jgi:hypothetical protein
MTDHALAARLAEIKADQHEKEASIFAWALVAYIGCIAISMFGLAIAAIVSFFA